MNLGSSCSICIHRIILKLWDFQGFISRHIFKFYEMSLMSFDTRLKIIWATRWVFHEQEMRLTLQLHFVLLPRVETVIATDKYRIYNDLIMNFSHEWSQFRRFNNQLLKLRNLRNFVINEVWAVDHVSLMKTTTKVTKSPLSFHEPWRKVKAQCRFLYVKIEIFDVPILTSANGPLRKKNPLKNNHFFYHLSRNDKIKPKLQN